LNEIILNALQFRPMEAFILVLVSC
jgi:hypothetical protein